MTPLWLCMLALLALAGCKERSRANAPKQTDPPAAKAPERTSQDHAGHDHADHDHDHDHDPAPAVKADEHDDHAGHDHSKDDHAKGEHAADAHADEVTLSPEAIGRYGVKVDTARSLTLRPTIITPARVAFNNEAMAHVGSPLRGRVVEIKVRLGQEVTKGDELCVIESPELGEAQVDLLQKRVGVDSAGPAVDLARASWDRAKALHEQTQGTSLAEVQRREAEYKAAVAAQRAAAAAATGSENRLHLLGMSQAAVESLIKTGEVTPRYTIHAAISGQVVQREITQGELVGPDREELMILADLSNVWVIAAVPEAHLFDVVLGARAQVRVGSSDAAPIAGRVSFISPVVDVTTRTAQVRIEVMTDGVPIRPGMFAEVEIEIGPGAGAPVVAVPDVAVQTVEGGPAVFVPVEGEASTFARRAVTIGKPVGGMVPILTGLAAGETVVVSGSFILKAELGKGSASHQH